MGAIVCKASASIEKPLSFPHFPLRRVRSYQNLSRIVPLIGEQTAPKLAKKPSESERPRNELKTKQQRPTHVISPRNEKESNIAPKLLEVRKSSRRKKSRLDRISHDIDSFINETLRKKRANTSSKPKPQIKSRRNSLNQPITTSEHRGRRLSYCRNNISPPITNPMIVVYCEEKNKTIPVL